MAELGSTFDLGRILQVSQAIKAQKQQSAEDAIRAKYLEPTLQAGLANQLAQGQQITSQQRIADMDVLSRAAGAVAQSADPVGTLHGLIQSPDIAPIFARHGIDPAHFANLPAEQLKTEALQLQQSFAPFLPRQAPISVAAGSTLVDPQNPNKALYSAPDKPDIGLADLGGIQQSYDKRTGLPIQGGGMRKTAAPASAEAQRPQLSVLTRPVEGANGLVQDQTFDSHTGQMTPIGKPYSKADASGSGGLGSRESVMFQRVANSANSAATALQNISELPVGASTGMFGIGASPGHSALESTFSVLKNKLSSQEVQDYNTMLAGVGRNLSTIETAGLAPNGSITQSMDSIQLREGDSQITKLRKLAEMRQIVEKGIEPNLANPKLPDEQKKLVRDIVAQVKASIPYTQHDITEMQRKQQTNPAFTLQDLIQQKGLRATGVIARTESGTGPIAQTGNWKVEKVE